MERVKRFLRGAASLRITVVCLLVLAVLTLWGTFYQVDYGLHAARRRFFGSWFLLAGGFVPIPGVKLIVTLLSVNLVAALTARLRYTWRTAGVVIVHYGVLVLFVGGGVTHYVARESSLTLVEGQSSKVAYRFEGPEDKDPKPVRLPFEVTLLDFIKETYPGTNMPREFTSRVHVRGPGIDREVAISMNRPFRHRGYAVYQSSYSESGEVERSTLAVVHNAGRLLPYVASLLMGVGLLLHFTVMLLSSIRRTGNA